MRCPRCEHDNAASTKHCVQCGVRMPLACVSCGTALPAGARFCPECAHPVGAEIPAGARHSLTVPPGAAPPGPALTSGDAERRQLTVMFCDLVGSTALSAELDPEEFRDLIRRYQAASATEIERVDGHIAQHLGDGLLVYFGFPRAHEDDAQRAVRAARGIVEALTHLARVRCRRWLAPLRSLSGPRNGSWRPISTA